MMNLPQEIKKEIFYYLPIPTLLNMMLVCKELNSITNTMDFWFNKLLIDFKISFSKRAKALVNPKHEYANFFSIYNLNPLPLPYPDILERCEETNKTCNCNIYYEFNNYLRYGRHFE